MNPLRMSVSLEPAPPPRGEDLPYDDGEPMETRRHRNQMTVLADSLSDHYRGRGDIFVGANMGVYFSETQARQRDFRAPDVFVVTDTHARDRNAWVVWEEDGRTPDVAIEITSPTTEHVDRGIKMQIYARMLHVSTYVIYDPFTLELEGFRLDGPRYVPIALDASGHLRVNVLGLSLGVVPDGGVGGDPALRWFDADGRMIPLEDERRADDAEARAHAAEDRADAAEDRADAAEDRADAAEVRADAAEVRAGAAEAEIARLKALLKR